MKIHLTVSRVHGDHMRCAVLKQTIGEAPSRCTDVQTDFASNFKVPVLKGAFKFQSTTTDILRAFAEQFVESEFQKVVPFANLHQRSAPGRRPTKVPAPAPVQSAKASANKSLTRIPSRFSTEFSTVVLKTSFISPRRPEPSIVQHKSRPAGGFFRPIAQ